MTKIQFYFLKGKTVQYEISPEEFHSTFSSSSVKKFINKLYWHNKIESSLVQISLLINDKLI